jgi:hypothetical protein
MQLTYEYIYTELNKNCDASGTIEVPLGWLNLIYQLNIRLKSMFPNYVIHQVKEKFGGLRFYYSINRDFTTSKSNKKKIIKFQTTVNEAEIIANYVCAICGNYNKENISTGWKSPRCREHA